MNARSFCQYIHYMQATKLFLTIKIGHRVGTLEGSYSGFALCNQLGSLTKLQRATGTSLNTRGNKSVFYSILTELAFVGNRPRCAQLDRDAGRYIVVAEAWHLKGTILYTAATPDAPLLVNSNETKGIIRASICGANPDADRFGTMHARVSCK
jgi:hypothetical protein